MTDYSPRRCGGSRKFPTSISSEQALVLALLSSTSRTCTPRSRSLFVSGWPGLRGPIEEGGDHRDYYLWYCFLSTQKYSSATVPDQTCQIKHRKEEIDRNPSQGNYMRGSSTLTIKPHHNFIIILVSNPMNDLIITFLVIPYMV